MPPSGSLGCGCVKRCWAPPFCAASVAAPAATAIETTATIESFIGILLVLDGGVRGENHRRGVPGETTRVLAAPLGIEHGARALAEIEGGGRHRQHASPEREGEDGRACANQRGRPRDRALEALDPK